MSGARLSPVEWDLSAVIGLFHALSTNNVTEDSEEPANSSAPSAQARASSVAPHHDASQSHKHLLGNFDSIWKFLDVPLDAPAPTVTSSTDRGISTNEKHRILDGQGSSASKGITWQDGLDGTGSGDDNRPKPKAPCAPRNTLSKKQKKQLRRQLKRTASPAHPLETTSGDSDSPEHPSLQARQSVDRQQIIQQILYGNAQSTLRTKSTKVTKSPKVSKIVKKKAAPGTPTPAAGTIRYRLRNRDVPAQPDSLRQNAHAFDPILAPRPAKIPNVYRIEDLAKQQTPTTLQSNQTLIASAYQTPPKPAENPNLISRAYQTPIQATKGSSDAPAASEMSEVPQRPTEGVELALYMYEKSMDLYDDHATAWETYHKVLLYDKLKILFPLEHQTLNSFYRSPALEPNGVHVFVDASNVSRQVLLSLLRSPSTLPTSQNDIKQKSLFKKPCHLMHLLFSPQPFPHIRATSSLTILALLSQLCSLIALTTPSLTSLQDNNRLSRRPQTPQLPPSLNPPSAPTLLLHHPGPDPRALAPLRQARPLGL